MKILPNPTFFINAILKHLVREQHNVSNTVRFCPFYQHLKSYLNFELLRE